MSVWDKVREVEQRRREHGTSEPSTGFPWNTVGAIALSALTFIPHSVQDYQTTYKPDLTRPGTTADTTTVADTVNAANKTARRQSKTEDQTQNKNEPVVTGAQDTTNTTQKNSSYHRPRTKTGFKDETIPILMYHKVGRPENRYTVSEERLETQLETLYENNYYCVSLDDYLEADFDDIPSGKKPFVITFDDAAPSQFQLTDQGRPDTSTAAGILEQSFEEYEDFGKGGTFYVSYAGDNHDFRHAFGGDESTKLSWLQENGYTVGYHTPYHEDNEHADPGDIDEQTTILHALIDDATSEPVRKHYAHPFGARPEGVAMDSLESTYTSIVDAWGGFAPHPRSPRFDQHSIPRVETNAKTFPIIIDRETYTVDEARNP